MDFEPRTLGSMYREIATLEKPPSSALGLLEVARTLWSMPEDRVPPMSYMGSAEELYVPCCHHGARTIWLYAGKHQLRNHEGWRLTLHHGWNHARPHSFLVFRRENVYWILDAHPCGPTEPVLLGPYGDSSTPVLHKITRSAFSAAVDAFCGEAERPTEMQKASMLRRWCSSYVSLTGKGSTKDLFEVSGICGYLEPKAYMRDCRSLLRALSSYLRTQPAH